MPTSSFWTWKTRSRRRKRTPPAARAINAAGDYAPRETAIRINAAGTPWHDADMEAAGKSGADAILLPKIHGAGEITAARPRRTACRSGP